MSDPLSEMRSQVDAAYAAADKLVREADAAARERANVPPRGYAPPPDPERTESERTAFGDLQALAGLIETVKDSVPPELARQLAEALRDLLVALRALIDWWIARLEREPEQPVEVQDIPID
jgi:hypothetical protein